MKILFVHPNFPAQFKHIAKAAAARGHEVYFVCQTHFGRTIPGITRLKLKGKLSCETLKKKKLNIFDNTKFLGEQFREGFVSLKNDGWNPDITICHSGWGCGLYLKEIWPDTISIAYLEWWFDPLSDFFSYDETNSDISINTKTTKKHYERNFFVSMELSSADKIVSPTKWQKGQLPGLLNRSCNVIFDGIDINLFRNNDNNSESSIPKITYGTRGMDALRGFPQLIKSIPKMNSIREKNIKIEIAGDETAYYGSVPKGYKNWKEWAIEYLKAQECEDSVVWRGFLGTHEYVEWLKSSWCHLYFTHPFVASWSLVEALATSIPIIASNVQPVIEFCQNTQGTYLIDHRSTKNIVTTIELVLQNQCYQKITYQRNLEDLSIDKALSKWELLTGVDLTT